MERSDEPEREGRARLSAKCGELVRGAKRRPRLTIAATLLAFGAVTLAGRSIARVVRGRRKPKEVRPTERAPEVPLTAATGGTIER